jgi:hypothetical protein
MERNRMLQNESITQRAVLERVAYRSIDVEAVLDPYHPTWIAFDPELGYVPADVVMRDGIDFSWSTYSHEPEGHRRMVNYRERPCRINTYGDSFTQCQQVSDDETWQERLAAHFGEPIRNFGSGGYGVWQAYLRAMRMEPTAVGAEYILLNIFDDDHIRNLDAARWIRTAWCEKERPADRAYPLHGLPWSHLRYDPSAKKWLELPGKCANDDELRALTDKERFHETFKDDPILRLFIVQQGGEADLSDLQAVADALDIRVDLMNPATRRADAETFHRAYGAKSTEYLLEKLRAWAKSNNRKLLILLSYCLGSVGGYLAGNRRFDHDFVAYLDREGYDYIDPLPAHAEDYKAFNLPIEEYIYRYYVRAAGAAVFGHYTPTGNHFYAFCIKNGLVDFLDPKPPAYREQP